MRFLKCWKNCILRWHELFDGEEEIKTLRRDIQSGFDDTKSLLNDIRLEMRKQ